MSLLRGHSDGAGGENRRTSKSEMTTEGGIFFSLKATQVVTKEIINVF